MKPKVIATEKEYQQALKRIEELMSAEEGTEEFDELELFATLVELYEEKTCPIDLPNPIEAIKFRMEQQGLKQTDLKEYLGSKSKVSEVLSGKRPLSLRMIRSLHHNLGIPAEVLIGKPDSVIEEDSESIDWQVYPVKNIVDNNWVDIGEEEWTDIKEHAEEIVRKFLAPVPPNLLAQPAYLRKGLSKRAKFNPYALIAWQCRVLTLALNKKLPKFEMSALDDEFVSDLVKLSKFQDGPLLAKEMLEGIGICVVFLARLPQTHTEGAAFLLNNGTPVIALTLRQDRLDYFWFTLLHELGHVALHLFNGHEMFIDEDDDRKKSKFENEADKFSRSALVPPQVWSKASVRKRPTAAAIRSFAKQLRISPAIVAGRIRFERKDYRRFSKLVGQGQVRKHFPNLDRGYA